MVDIADGRHFKNPWLSDCAPQLSANEEWKKDLALSLVKLVTILTEKLSSLTTSDISMYTGLSGIGLFYHRLCSVDRQFIDNSVRSVALSQSQKITRRCLRHLDLDRLYKNVSVFTSSIGALCLGALVDDPEHGDVRMTVDKCFEQIISASKFAAKADSAMPDEALYGRTGYLCALLALSSARRDVPVDIVSSVVRVIIQSGKDTAKRYQSEGVYRSLMLHSKRSDLAMPPLMFEWHEKAYLGGAHGFAGILLTLVKVRQIYPEALSAEVMDDLVIPTIHWMGELQMDSGNWPSSLGSGLDRDVLVHWCHGATGVVPLMLAAYQVSTDFGIHVHSAEQPMIRFPRCFSCSCIQLPLFPKKYTRCVLNSLNCYC
ncbi:LanC protein 1 [Paragonimus heterotremus]|uniref:LanC protein 1 n=1 Tax=Paragonimus heterotremus TaxID=100268 RepID=A0A8J4SGY2_9TREM|nr:LanC protein 1 [Paragonimus heterotremus]